ncbi:Putative zinc finger protein F44E2.7 [Caenorhabditis elegans]|uniref:Isoform d of Putative zinc finger protein F44E2.7 n=1 Tax=Caenorhabditis elegans TaxID=6239 RepID=P34437-4|nr:Putative zinc finger protein F44E2.7 [Caenorhabditis elegans]CCD71228.1 Putative zinc finger protein F44E2.7 [Caenorhabditis elegans]|eukprot:NP_001022588.1 Putative zinc finger protein F44E2.7 [Caenorhabditis elegans]
MVKPTSSLLQRYKNNVRVDPSTLNHYLCYYCGKTLSDRLEYQQHMLKVHEVMSQSYQLWSDHTMDTLGLIWSESKRSYDRDTSCSLPASPMSRESRNRNSDDDYYDYVYEDEKPKRRRIDVEQSRRSVAAAAEKHRKLLEEQRRKAEAEYERKRKADEKKKEKAIKDEEKRKAEDLRKCLQLQQQKTAAAAQIRETAEKAAVARRMSTFEVGESSEQLAKPEGEKRKRRRTESRWREIESDSDKPEVTALVKKILEESKKKEASSQEVEDADLVPELSTRKPYDNTEHVSKLCKVCKKGPHYTFANLFEHYQDLHNATIKSLHYYGFNGNKLIGKKNLIERDHCQRCVIKFPRARDYFAHMIKHHVYESVRCQLDFENATNADVEARMMFRDRILTLGYNFKFEQVADPNLVSDVLEPGQEPSTSAEQEDPSSLKIVKLEEPELEEQKALKPESEAMEQQEDVHSLNPE